jgi:RNA polymerase sigma factor (sigma-70 family)
MTAVAAGGCHARGGEGNSFRLPPPRRMDRRPLAFDFGAKEEPNSVPIAYGSSPEPTRMRKLPPTEPTTARRQATELEQLVLPHLDAAYNLARWLLRDPTLAQDVVQDAVVRAITYFHSYRGGDAKAWLLQIVRNTAYTALRARQKAGEVPLDDPRDDEGPGLDLPDPADDPETVVGRRQELTQLDQALAALPVHLRECLVLRELEELSYKEIVRITGVPIGTVMSRLWRARQALLRTHAGGSKT